MKDTIKITLYASLLIYLLFAFCKVEVNPFMWKEGYRVALCFFSLLVSAFALLVRNDIN